MPLQQNALFIITTLQTAGFDAVFAGGCVRDRIILHEEHDIDIATNATPTEVGKLFPHTIFVGEQFGVVRVRIDEQEFEVATFRNDGSYSDGRRPDSIEFSSMEEDAKRRDLTINGLFFNPVTEEIFDFVGGKQDIHNKIIRFIGDPEDRILEDKLRMLRAVRFTAKLDFTLDTPSYFAIKKHAEAIVEISQERIRDEFCKILQLDKPSIAINLLKDLGLLKMILPEFMPTIGCEQNPKWHPEGDVFIHTMLVVDAAPKNNLHVRLAAFFHDIGKPETSFLKDNDRIVSYGHEFSGARITREAMTRMKFSNQQLDTVSDLVENHMKLHSIPSMRTHKVRRVLGLSIIEDLILLCIADCAGSINDISWLEFVRSKQKEFPDMLPAQIVTGADLIAQGKKPGPEFKNILNKIYDLQLNGGSTREQLLSRIKSFA